jgi:hypothetical protein
MALRPNTASFTPGTGSQQPPPSVFNKSSGSVGGSSSSSAPSSSATQSIPSKAHSAKNKAFPKGAQGKRGQTQRKFEKSSRLAEEALSADPIIETVFAFYLSDVLII